MMKKGMKKWQAPAALRWLEESILINEGEGSAAFYHPTKGWGPPYPETTGYIIETLWDHYHQSGKPGLRDCAISCTNWLCRLQKADGSWAGGVGGKLPPVIFDTGMILFGLARSWQETGEPFYRKALENGAHWLLLKQSKGGRWEENTYVEGHIPAYHSRVVWAVLYANTILQDETIRRRMALALEQYFESIQRESLINASAIYPNQPALTHSIAYTLRGLLEAGLLLDTEDYLPYLDSTAREIVAMRRAGGPLAGQYKAGWKGDKRFRCPVGELQLSIFLARLSRTACRQDFADTALQLFTDASGTQCRLPFRGFYGGIPGSFPFWGPYQRLKLINWGAKFFLDAVREFS